jgi:hypothetical protein
MKKWRVREREVGNVGNVGNVGKVGKVGMLECWNLELRNLSTY